MFDLLCESERERENFRRGMLREKRKENDERDEREFHQKRGGRYQLCCSHILSAFSHSDLMKATLGGTSAGGEVPASSADQSKDLNKSAPRTFTKE